MAASVSATRQAKFEASFEAGRGRVCVSGNYRFEDAPTIPFKIREQYVALVCLVALIIVSGLWVTFGGRARSLSALSPKVSRRRSHGP